MKVALGADHGGYRLKEEIKKLLAGRGIEFHDFGTHSEQSVDYPDFALAVAESVAGGTFPWGLFVVALALGFQL